jgi:hypothetical protein
MIFVEWARVIDKVFSYTWGTLLMHLCNSQVFQLHVCGVLLHKQ